MYYKDIINSFKTIYIVNQTSNLVKVTGIDDKNRLFSTDYVYKHTEVAKEVTKKVSMFIGI